ncbi:MAG: redox-sensing transcriptional repressor Rex [Actinobacteria bacterium]|nr:MAG: redox-sensing transcriptional repressor Rex [Actinomycetota bacterium]
MGVIVPESSGSDSRLFVVEAQTAQRIPQGVIERLPQYLNVLLHLRGEGCQTVSSARLSELAEVNAAQIRRDLAYFGSFGKRGVGYDISILVDRIQRILGSDHAHRIAIVGAGNLGMAIASYDGLRARGFVVAALFDTDPRKIGTRVGDVIVRDIAELPRVVTEQQIRFGVIAVPPEGAQEAADRLCAAGIQVILNYSPAFVGVPGGVTLHNTDPVRELLHTLYYLSRAEGMAGA